MYDQKRAKAEAKAHGLVDFADRSIKSYLLLALFIGGLVLIV